MSDPVKIENDTVVFSPDDLDIDKFLRDKKEHSEHDDHLHPIRGDYSNMCYMCWYLRDNSEVDKDGNLVIRFGHGNSAHTQNSLEWAIREVLDLYIKDKDSNNPKKHTFIITSVFEEKYPFYVEFSNLWVERLLKRDGTLFGEVIDRHADYSNIPGTVSFDIAEILKNKEDKKIKDSKYN